MLYDINVNNISYEVCLLSEFPNNVNSISYEANFAGYFEVVISIKWSSYSIIILIIIQLVQLIIHDEDPYITHWNTLSDLIE